jgi:hypothetical protein
MHEGDRVDDSTTKRLLIEVSARSSESEADVWGLISRNPFASVRD